jgi:16S rRNA (cytosine1402-N4)-methyltransferase
MSSAPHIPVLKEAVLSLFGPLKAGVVVDCTAGYGGHGRALLERFEQIRYIGIDQDPTAIAYCQNHLAEFGDRVRLLQGPFSEVLPTLADEPLVAVLADLGVSSLQLDCADRGFGFESPVLDMRMDGTAAKSAAEVVNGYPESELVRIFRLYGEEPQAKKMAALVVHNRPFSSARALAGLIESRFKRGRIHPATRIFQAIRIEVNDELGEIERLLDTLEGLARADLKVGVIAFHSLEDRLIKDRFRKWAQNCICPPESWRCTCGGNRALGQLLMRKPHVATTEEIRQNPRSRSAKLRGFQFKKGR